MVDSIPLTALKNAYYVMRHGQSLANTAGIIVSHPENGLNDYGLSDKGRQQVVTAINACGLPATTRIFSSDFKRACETAEIAQQRLNCSQPVEFDVRLRERYFGDLELGPDNRYPEVWSFDQNSPDHREFGVEPVASVIQRAHSVLLNCEKNLTNETCLLIAHGDILQILQTLFFGLPPNHHRQLPHLDTAEVRELIRQ
jgi:probable phosphoglycerate mutase